jgi:2-oxoglutarate dehydrogenase E1 component
VVDDPATSGGSLGYAVNSIDPSVVRRVLLCSGKVAYDAIARRDLLIAGTGDQTGDEPVLPIPGVSPQEVSVVRIEQLYPWPEEALADVLSRYPLASEVVWVQEEPENMGAWSYVHGRLHRLLRDRYDLSHVSRAESASPATGSAAVHQLENEDLLTRSFG